MSHINLDDFSIKDPEMAAKYQRKAGFTDLLIPGAVFLFCLVFAIIILLPKWDRTVFLTRVSDQAEVMGQVTEITSYSPDITSSKEKSQEKVFVDYTVAGVVYQKVVASSILNGHVDLKDLNEGDYVKVLYDTNEVENSIVDDVRFYDSSSLAWPIVLIGISLIGLGFMVYKVKNPI